jgi:ABC-2 type transport system ATP-binding protein
LADKIDSEVDTLSRGMKQRLGLARCLVHDPQLLLLDEPASGLDPRARTEMKAILRQLRGMGKTILISSHILPELVEMCDTIGMIENGRMIAAERVEAMAGKTTGRRRLSARLLEVPDEFLRTLAADSRISEVERQGSTIRFYFSGSETEQADLLCGWVRQNVPVVSFGPDREQIEEMFLSVTGEGSHHGV